MRIFIVSFFVLLVTMSFKSYAPITKDIHVKMSSEELKLYKIIMEYRKSKNLPSIPLSKSLSYVAQVHAKDLAVNKPDKNPKCNLHSWSKSANWSSCCYTPDHKNADCMWKKPIELTNYTSDGFEIAASTTDSIKGITADQALMLWKKSTGHNNVITNQDIWKKSEWKAIGIGMYKGYATVWFGNITDPDGEPDK